MLATLADTLQVIHLALLALGACSGLGVVVWLARAGRWRDPLAGVALPQQGPTVAAVGAVLLVFFALQFSLQRLLVHPPPAEAAGPLAPGSDLWHRTMSAEQGAALIVAGLIVILLAYTRRTPTRRPGLWRGSAAAIVALLVLLPIVTLQEEAGRVVWRWLHPDVAPPVHAVLQALEHSAWGTWGRWQLLIGAVLVAPLAEELFFRGLLLQAISHHTGLAWPAILASAAAFGAVHAQPQDVLPLASMGIVLGYLRFATGSVWPCILAHMLFNARTMTVVLLAPELLHAA